MRVLKLVFSVATLMALWGCQEMKTARLDGESNLWDVEELRKRPPKATQTPSPTQEPTSAPPTSTPTPSATPAPTNSPTVTSIPSQTPTPTPLPSSSSTLLLEDFASMRTNGYQDALWYPYYNDSQTGSLEVKDGNQRLRINVAEDGVSGTNGEVVGLYVLFWPLQLDRFPDPTGFTRHYIKSGTWNPLVNRMEFMFKCDMTKTVEESYESIHIGTYVKPRTAPSFDQGMHYYHFFHPNIYANRWVKMEMNWAPSYRVSSDASTNYSPDVEWVNPTSSQPVHYFDGLTSWYLSMGSDNGVPYNCWFDDFKMFAETGEPDEKVKSIAATYNGTAYEISWETLKNTVLDFEIRYSTQSMKASGFSSGTLAGTRQKQDMGGYAGIRFTTSPMPEHSIGLYFAIRPVGDARFTEIFVPKY
jgi:hypothetical protein